MLELRQIISTTASVEDPDLLMLLNGGFAYYDKDGRIVSAVSLSGDTSEQCVHFSPPEHLPAADADL